MPSDGWLVGTLSRWAFAVLLPAVAGSRPHHVWPTRLRPSFCECATFPAAGLRVMDPETLCRCQVLVPLPLAALSIAGYVPVWWGVLAKESAQNIAQAQGLS